MHSSLAQHQPPSHCRDHRILGRSLAVLSVLAVLSFAGGSAADAPEGTSLEVSEVILSRGLDRGEPVEPGTTFRRSDGRIYATIHLRNPERLSTDIRVAFERAAGRRSSGGIELDVPPRVRYRTVARTGTRRAAGRYRCVVYRGEEILHSVEFELVD